MTPVKIAMPLLAFAVVPPTVWWSLDNAPAIRVDRYELVTPAVPRGGGLEVRYHTTFLRRCSGTAARYFVDAAGESIPAESYQFRDGIGRSGEPVPLDNPTWVPVRAVVPGRATPGSADYQNVSEFFCNPLQRYLHLGISFAYPLIRFDVTAAPVVAAQPPITAFQPIAPDVDLRDRALLMPSPLVPKDAVHE